MDRGRTRVEVAHQVKNAVPDTRGVDADVLDVEAFRQLLDLFSLVLERLPPPTVFFKDAELRPGFQRWGNDHAGGIVARAAGVVTEPNRAVAIRAFVFGFVVFP